MAFYTASKPTANEQGRVEIIVDTDNEALVIYGEHNVSMAYHFSTLDWINTQVEIALVMEDLANG